MGPWSNFTQCDRAQDFLTKSGLSFKIEGAPGAKSVDMTIGSTKVEGWDNAKWTAALRAAGYPPTADPAKVNWFMAELILVIMVIYVTMVYGPIAAFLVEMFPTKIRYTSMSLPYHIGNGWFGGMLPLLATAIVAATGDIYAGLWYPIGVAVMTLVIGAIFLRDTQGRRHVDRLRRRDSEDLSAATDPTRQGGLTAALFASVGIGSTRQPVADAEFAHQDARLLRVLLDLAPQLAHQDAQIVGFCM